MRENASSCGDTTISLPSGLKFKKVLCWVGSTDQKDWTVQVGKALAASAHGLCHVVMCLDCPPTIPQQHPSARVCQKPLTPELIGQAAEKLAALYDEEVHTMVLPGHPITEIRRYARNRQMDLIVMGEQGLSVERAYGDRLLENAPCAVMILVIPKQQDNISKPRSGDHQRNAREMGGE